MRERNTSGPAGAADRGTTPSGLAALAFAQFGAGLYQFLLRRLHSAENAEDLSQEVYLRLLRAAGAHEVRCPQAYAYRIAFNVLYEFKLREKGEPMVFDSQALERAAGQLPDGAATPDEAYEDIARERRFAQAIAELPPMQRAVLRLATHHDLPHAKIAAMLGISVSTMRNHLYKAIANCRHRFAGAAQP